MFPEIGHFSLVIAIVLALICATFPLLGTYSRPSERAVLWMRSAMTLSLAQFCFISIAFVSLALSFVRNDFTVSYVAQHSNTLLPLQYKISAVWGGHEGSLLLWIWILSLWMAAVAIFSKQIPLILRARVLSVLSMIALGFLSFILVTSNPFDRLLPDFPMDGNDLNPLLQDVGLIFHPPLLYMGYVGFSVSFAFAIAALMSGYYDSEWAKWSRPWTKLAWSFLTVGIALGSWWAYYELGWGGWWFWDPVENASFMPWLTGVALIHSQAACEKRGSFKAWSILIAIVTFSLSLLGTFLVRSGVLTSVHAFASDPSRGYFILVFLSLVVGGSLLLFSFQAEKLKSRQVLSFFSREFLLMLNNILLLVACATVLLGTLFPIISEAFNLGKISVGPPYFNALFFPLSLCMLFFMAFAPVFRWQNNALSEMKRLPLLMLISIAISLSVEWVLLGGLELKSAIIVSLCIWVMLVIGHDFWNRKTSLNLSPVQSWRKLSSSKKNMYLGHLGLLISLTGIALTSVYSEERDVSMGQNESLVLGSYQFTFLGVRESEGPNYRTMVGEVQVSKKEKVILKLYPEKRYYYVQNNPMTEAAIDPTLMRDLYVALGEPLGNNKWSLRIYYKPYIRWIWLGAIIMAASCLIYLIEPSIANKSGRK